MRLLGTGADGVDVGDDQVQGTAAFMHLARLDIALAAILIASRVGGMTGHARGVARP